MNDGSLDTDPQPRLEQGSPAAPPAQIEDRDGASVDLALRFLVGLLSLGGEEAARRLQDAQRRLDEDPSLWSARTPTAKKTWRRQTWHLGVGLIKRGRKRLRKGIRRGYDLSLRASSRVSSASGRLGAGRLTRPVRQPIAARLNQWRQQAALIAQEGELEEQQSRALAAGTLATLIAEIMEEIARNPDMQEFVQDLIGQQGKGMATSIMDNTRSVTLTADDAADALLRWLLRRPPRHELPPSPVEGQHQAMYEPTVRVEGGTPDVD